MKKELDEKIKYKTIRGYTVEKLERKSCFFEAVVNGFSLKYTFYGEICGWDVAFHEENFYDYCIVS